MSAEPLQGCLPAKPSKHTHAVGVCVPMCACICVCMCAYMCVYVHVHVHICVCLYSNWGPYVRHESHVRVSRLHPSTPPPSSAAPSPPPPRPQLPRLRDDLDGELQVLVSAPTFSPAKYEALLRALHMLDKEGVPVGSVLRGEGAGAGPGVPGGAGAGAGAGGRGRTSSAAAPMDVGAELLAAVRESDAIAIKVGCCVCRGRECFISCPPPPPRRVRILVALFCVRGCVYFVYVLSVCMHCVYVLRVFVYCVCVRVCIACACACACACMHCECVLVCTACVCVCVRACACAPC